VYNLIIYCTYYSNLYAGVVVDFGMASKNEKYYKKLFWLFFLFYGEQQFLETLPYDCLLNIFRSAWLYLYTVTNFWLCLLLENVQISVQVFVMVVMGGKFISSVYLQIFLFHILTAIKLVIGRCLYMYCYCRFYFMQH